MSEKNEGLLEKFAELHEQYEKIGKEFLDLVDENLDNALMEIVKKLPKKYKKIGWTQYTPYFNDGDSCEFQVYYEVDYLYINGESIETLSELQSRYLENGTWYVNLDWNKEVCDDLLRFAQLISSIPKNVMMEAYGDHALVEVSRTKVERNNYDHD